MNFLFKMFIFCQAQMPHFRLDRINNFIDKHSEVPRHFYQKFISISYYTLLVGIGGYTILNVYLLLTHPKEWRILVLRVLFGVIIFSAFFFLSPSAHAGGLPDDNGCESDTACVISEQEALVQELLLHHHHDCSVKPPTGITGIVDSIYLVNDHEEIKHGVSCYAFSLLKKKGR